MPVGRVVAGCPKAAVADVCLACLLADVARVGLQVPLIGLGATWHPDARVCKSRPEAPFAEMSEAWQLASFAVVGLVAVTLSSAGWG